MAFTKVLGPGIHTQANIHSHNINSSGIITATKFVGPITGGGGDFNAGIVTCTTLDVNGNADISGNLVVHGDTTTLNTTLREVELLHVDANSSVAAGIITQRGSGDILNLFDNNAEVLTVIDGGRVGIGKTNPDTNSILHIKKASVNQVKIETTNSNSYGVLRFAESDHDGVKDKYLIAYGDDTGATADGFALKNQIGHIGFFAGGVAPGDEALRIESTGRVGVNTTSARVNGLHIYDKHLAVTEGYPLTWLQPNSSTSRGRMTCDSGGNYLFQFGSGNDEKIRFKSNGAVGIGTNNPLGTLDIFNANADASNLNSLGAQINAAWIRIGDVDAAGKTFSNGLGTKLYNQGTAHWSYGMLGQDFLITNTSGDGDKLFPSNRSTHFFIKSDGKVGIGTESPGVELEIKGTDATLLRLDSSNAQGTTFRIRNSGTDKMYMGLAADFITGQSGNVTDSAIRASGHLIVASGGGTERLRITSDGHLKIPDSGKILLGGAQTGSGSCQFIHDSTDTFIQNKVGDLKIANNVAGDVGGDIIIQAMNGENSINCVHDAQVELSFNGSQKLATTATGIAVTGEVAASQDFPSIRPTLDFNFAAVKKLDPSITYTRSGPASYTDELGYLKLVGPNVPRFDHDPYTRESKGLLIEESRTNLMKSITHPHLPKSTYSSNSNGSIVEVSDDVLAPDGSAHTLKLHWTNYTANQNGYRRVGNTNTELGTLSAGTYGFSFFVKRGTDGNHNMEEFLAGTQSGIGAAQYHFTSQDFSPSYAVNVTLCNNSNVTIDKYPDGWYRLSGILTAAQSFTPDNTGASYYVLGNSTFKTFFEAMPFYHWGFQLEVGACPSSYIGGTVSATTTRGWEVPIITGKDLTDVFNPTEGTMFYEASVSSLTNDNQPIVAFRDLGSTADNYHAMGYRIGGGSSGNIRTWFKSNNANTYLSNHGSTGMVAGSPYKHMYGYKLNDATDAYNTGAASAQTTDSSVTPMLTSGVVDELRFGGYYSGPETTTYSLEAGHIKRFSYWNTKLSNTQIKTYVS